MYKVIVLFGKSASGKDTILKWILNNIENTSGIVSYTTRPPRDYEVDGKDYYFISNEEFTEKVLNKEMLEATCFNNWFYGAGITTLKQDKINVGVFNVEGINCLIQDNRIEILPIYVYASDKTRLLRSLNREESPDCAEICRRFFTDDEDFKEEKYDFNYEILDNENNFNAAALTDMIRDFCDSGRMG